MKQQPTFPRFTDGIRRDPDPIQALHELPDRVAEAAATADAPNPGQQTGHTARPRPGSQPPTDLDRIDALRPDPHGVRQSTHSHLARAARAVLEDHPHLDPPAASITAAAQWLINHAHLWREDDFLGPYITDEIAAAYATLAAILREHREPVLRCNHTGAHGDPCGAQLHPIEGGHMMRCDAGHEINHRAEIRREVSLQMLPLGELRDTLARWWGIRLPDYQVMAKWAQRGILGQPEWSGGKLRYNVGRALEAVRARQDTPRTPGPVTPD